MITPNPFSVATVITLWKNLSWCIISVSLKNGFPRHSFPGSNVTCACSFTPFIFSLHYKIETKKKYKITINCHTCTRGHRNGYFSRNIIIAINEKTTQQKWDRPESTQKAVQVEKHPQHKRTTSSNMEGLANAPRQATARQKEKTIIILALILAPERNTSFYYFFPPLLPFSFSQSPANRSVIQSVSLSATVSRQSRGSLLSSLGVGFPSHDGFGIQSAIEWQNFANCAKTEDGKNLAVDNFQHGML